MVDVIEQRIVIDMYHKKEESYNSELANELKHQIEKAGYREVGIDYTLKNGIKFYFSKED